MAKYDSYIDSQIPYVGAIPSHWKTAPSKRVMHKEKRICDSYAGQDIISLTMKGAIVRDLGAGGKMPTTFDGYQFVYPGELLMCLFDIDVTPRCVGRVYNEGLTSPAYSSFVLHDNADLGYFYYYYLMLDHTKELLHLAKNLRHSLTEEQLGQIKVPLPPLNEQKIIAEYLDKEAERIDAMIDEAKSSIEVYKTWKTSIIYEVVTKGLDPNVEMKQSGIDWVGDIPKHWKTAPLKRLVSCNDSTLPENTEPEFEFEYIDIGSVQHGRGITQVQRMKFKNSPSRARRIVSENDVIISTVRTYLKAVAVIDKITSPTIVSTGFAVLRPRNIYAIFLYYAVLSNSFISAVEANSVGMSYPAINASDILSMKIPYPSDKKEQASIADYLNMKCSNIDNLIAEKEALVADLEAYKKSLIFEVVTGKRKVV